MKIKLFDQDEKQVWEKEVDKAEFQHLKRITAPELTNTSAWGQFLTPVRTNSVKHLAMDFFSPFAANTIYYNGYPINLSCAEQCAIIPLVFLELLSMPVRLITLIPRAIYNAAQPEHPFREWLHNEGVPEEYLMGDSIKIKLERNPKIKNYNTNTGYDETQGMVVTTETPNCYKSVREFRVNFFAPHMLFNESVFKGGQRVEGDELTQYLASH